jgi:hypothetical protein
VANFPLLLANTEYPISLPAGTKNFCMQTREGTRLQVADTAGLSGTTYFTLFPGVPYSIESVSGSSTIDLYVQSTKPNQIIEILYWT